MFENYVSEPILSPSGRYYLIATVNKTDRNVKGYADVVIHLYSTDGKLLSDRNTRAGDASKWAVGWEKDSDTVIVFSSNIGSGAYRIHSNRLEAREMNDAFEQRAEILKALKYTKPKPS